MNDFDDLLTPRELAQAFGMRPATIRRWARQGLIPCVKISRTVRFRRSDLERLFKSNTKQIDAIKTKAAMSAVIET